MAFEITKIILNLNNENKYFTNISTTDYLKHLNAIFIIKLPKILITINIDYYKYISR